MFEFWICLENAFTCTYLFLQVIKKKGELQKKMERSEKNYISMENAFKNSVASSRVEAKLWAIYRGLTILLQKGTMDVDMDIETDATQAIKLIQDGPSHNSPYKAIVEDTKFLMKRM